MFCDENPMNVWADVRTDHLKPAERSMATRSKNALIEQQRGRRMAKAPYEVSGMDPFRYVIKTLSQFERFLDECIQIADKTPSVLIYETKGSSSLWTPWRKALDKKYYYKNDETSGVTAIMMNFLVRGEEPNKMAFIDIRRIIDHDLDGKPNLPDAFYRLLTHRQVMVTGENVVKHLKRTENSFFDRLGKVCFANPDDLVNRWAEKGGPRPWCDNVGRRLEEYEFRLNPLTNNGLLVNYHLVKGSETFFKNPYEVVADWESYEDMRKSQLVHALNKVWFSASMVEDLLDCFNRWKFSLSAMGQVYPECGAETRVDHRMKDALEKERSGTSKIEIQVKWFEDTLWPSNPRDGGSKLGSRLAEVGEAGCPRAAQRQKDKYRRMMNHPNLTPMGTRGEKRHVVSDVSDEEDAEVAQRKRRNGKMNAIRRAEFAVGQIVDNEAKPNATKIQCDETNTGFLRELFEFEKRRFTDHDIEFAVTVLEGLQGKLHPPEHKRVVKAICAYFRTFWEYQDYRKESAIATLAYRGYFLSKVPLSLYAMLLHMNPRRIDPRTLLQMDVTHDQLAEYVAQLPQRERENVVAFLSRYAYFSNEERLIELESCEFFTRRDWGKYMKSDAQVEGALRTICRNCDLSPTDMYFRGKRGKFINDVIDQGKEGFVSTANAAKMIMAHVGGDWDDKKDAVKLACRWPKLSEMLHAKFFLAGHNRGLLHCDRNLAVDVKCRPALHDDQTVKKLRFLRTEEDVGRMKVDMASAETVVIHTDDNRDPRAFDLSLQLVAFGAKDADLFAFFPLNLDAKVKEMIEDFLSSKTLFLRRDAFVKTLRKEGRVVKYIHAGELIQNRAGGRSDLALADFVWKRRFCGLTSLEWMTDPLNEHQEYHVAYALNLTLDFLRYVDPLAMNQYARLDPSTGQGQRSKKKASKPIGPDPLGLSGN